MSFWDNLPELFTVLAPMEDVTDVVFRRTVAKAGRPDVFFTEFTNAASYCSVRGNLATAGRLVHEPSETPLVAQIWGTSPDNFAVMSADLAKMGFAGIDINMGCPAKNVVKSGGGSGLIGNYDVAEQLIVAAKSGGLPVSVKTRLGVRQVSEYEPWLSFLLKCDLANLTVHLRTRKEMSKVAAHYEMIDQICELRDQLAPRTKITINGDVKNLDEAKVLKSQHPGIDGVMIGRGVFTNPFCFVAGKTPGVEELVTLLRYQLDQYDRYRVINAKFNRNFDSLKHFFKIYLTGFAGAAKVREQAYACHTTDEVRAVLSNAGL